MGHLPLLILLRLLKSLSNLGSFCQLPTQLAQFYNRSDDPRYVGSPFFLAGQTLLLVPLS
jgi:hypothetical protein